MPVNKGFSLPETNIAPQNDWLVILCNTSFLLGWPIFRGYVSFRECNIIHLFYLLIFWQLDPNLAIFVYTFASLKKGPKNNAVFFWRPGVSTAYSIAPSSFESLCWEKIQLEPENDHFQKGIHL